ncbi:alpha-1,4-glucan--maltose-1-phosphate maltosyltransferase [Achromobacter xylosoxidans]|uniref:alpha-1,4-glucan--maltose-1-phosphate maltosyltransferase n=1 Tax=Alcaligenes xylosoxydans xylosoxydans TaxID=85698 RepID=UPI000B48B4EA|nr:alpha-1,4-glucan--maltose-1-phosphate maltosyltransferase [Achromobacter xylosoxidans]
MPTAHAVHSLARLRLYHARGGATGDSRVPGAGLGPALYARLQQRGFDALLLPAPWLLGPDSRSPAPLDADGALLAGKRVPMVEWIEHAVGQLAEHGLALYLDIVLDRCAIGAVPDTTGPGWYQAPAEDPARDPRMGAQTRDALRLRPGPPPPGFVQAWATRLRRWTERGVAGYAFHAPQCLPAQDWAELAAALHGPDRATRLYAWAQGLAPEPLAALRGAGLDGLCSSLPWWDFKSGWLAEEDGRLRAVATVIASPPRMAADKRAAWTAALCADVLMFDDEEDAGLPDVAAANRWFAQAGLRGPLRLAGGRDGHCTMLLRDCAAGTVVLALNPSDAEDASVDWDALAPLLPPADFLSEGVPDGLAPQGNQIAPAGCAMYLLEPTHPVREASRHVARRMDGAASQRIVVEQVSPAVDGGAFPVKCIPHERIAVHADIYMDGHELLAAELRWRAADESAWRATPFARGLNDRWEASFRPRRIGPHEFSVHAWLDAWQTFRHDLEVKHQAGVDVRLEVEEGLLMLRAALARARNASHPGALRVRNTLQKFGKGAEGELAPATPQQIADLLDADLADTMRELDERPFEYVSPAPYPVWVDRSQACHASWYELFPRSQSARPGQHGTFDDVIARLPDLREMGFDVLYLPPIHPIGQRNRKGRNNSLQAAPDDVGSPYAIGSALGGHDAIEPLLGGLDGFLRLVDAAQAHGMEVALDFAIQCSPDHPWLTRHPDWFSWRPDGSLRHAENPPKKYQDIVNVAFYGAAAHRRARKLALWRALRDVVLFWAQHGVRTFRVDNPHTKPLPFWQWLIAEVHAQHPDVIFLSEAFTRPKMMYRLAKIGFTQSYTYFTWRNGKAELEAYLQEVSTPPAADFFRPHFFVNTPDINPYFLQSSGRPGFLIRAALAALGSGLWGMYSGFELCEAAALPGKEEYLDSEKYELRQRDWFAPGNIRAEITRLNQIRRNNPALQTHRGLTLAQSGNDRVLAFCKSTPGRGNFILAAISLDPFQPQDARIEAPFWLFGQADTGRLIAEDLLAESSEPWQGQTRELTLHPDQPYRVWRLSLHG